MKWVAVTDSHSHHIDCVADNLFIIGYFRALWPCSHMPEYAHFKQGDEFLVLMDDLFHTNIQYSRSWVLAI